MDRLWKGLQSTVASRKIDTVYGDGRLVSPTKVAVGDTVYEGAHVVLATGSQPRTLPGLEIDGEPGDHQRPRADPGPGARARW